MSTPQSLTMFAWTNNPADRCMFCVQWAKEIGDGVPFFEGEHVTTLYGGVHPQCFGKLKIPRRVGQWQRPLVWQWPDGVKGKEIPYSRVSSLAKRLDNTAALEAWKMRVVAVGLTRDPVLFETLQTLCAVEDPLNTQKDALKDLVSSAFEVGGGTRAAQKGTTQHAITEVIANKGNVDERKLPAKYRAVLAGYREAMDGIETLATEVFVVNDEVSAAGTFDQLLRLPDGRVVLGDTKTGANEPDFADGCTTQVATYARGSLYDAVSGLRFSIHPELDVDFGLMIHLPLDGRPCVLYELDLAAGWQRAQVAAAVGSVRKISRPPRFRRPEPSIPGLEVVS